MSLPDPRDILYPSPSQPTPPPDYYEYSERGRGSPVYMPRNPPSRPWIPPPLPDDMDTTDQEPQGEEDDTTKKIKKFAFGFAIFVGIFCLLWWLWLSLCSGSGDDDEDQEGSFCQILDGAAQLMNDITAGITFMVQNIIILVSLAVLYMIVGIFCNVSSKCPDSLMDAIESLNEWRKGPTEREGDFPHTEEPQRREEEKTDPNEQKEEEHGIEEG